MKKGITLLLLASMTSMILTTAVFTPKQEALAAADSDDIEQYDKALAYIPRITSGGNKVIILAKLLFKNRPAITPEQQQRITELKDRYLTGSDKEVVELILHNKTQTESSKSERNRLNNQIKTLQKELAAAHKKQAELEKKIQEFEEHQA
jgi:hypothetical protein